MSSKRKASDSDYTEVVESKRAKNTMVSFTKRKQGLFGKASELCSKFDAQIAILVLSPSENPFSFGHSSVEDVIRRYDSLVYGTAAVVGEEARTVNESRRRELECELEALRVRVKEKERARREVDLNPNGGDRLINVENCESVEELERFKVKCLAVLQLIREKLRRNGSPLVDSGNGSGSLNVAGNNNSSLVHYQENDMSFPLTKYGSDSGFESMISAWVPTTEDLAIGNDMSFPLLECGDYGGSGSSGGGSGFGCLGAGSPEITVDKKILLSPSDGSDSGDYGGSGLSGGGSGFGSLGAGSQEVMVDKQMYLSSTDGSNSGSIYNYKEDSLNFVDQTSCGSGVGDENLEFCLYEDNNNNLLHGEENDMSLFEAMLDDNGFGTMSTSGFDFGFMGGGECSFW